MEMEYNKPSLDINQQVQRLMGRGMQGDPEYMAAKLAIVSYNRLSAYWRIYRNDDGRFMPNTSFKAVWDVYVFDQRLRLLVMDAIERIEVAVRSRLAYHHSQVYGPFGYANDPVSLPAIGKHNPQLLIMIQNQISRSHVEYVMNFTQMYGDKHEYPPLWMTVEAISFGLLVNLYRSVPDKIKKSIAIEFCVCAPVFESWMIMLRIIRNISAHHARLWNISLEMTAKPKLPDRNNGRQWYIPTDISNKNMYAILSICKWCMDSISPSSNWYRRIFKLFDDFLSVPRSYMGIPDDWRNHEIWKSTHSH